MAIARHTIQDRAAAAGRIAALLEQAEAEAYAVGESFLAGEIAKPRKLAERVALVGARLTEAKAEGDQVWGRR